MSNSNNVHLLEGVGVFLNNDPRAQITQFAAFTESNSRHKCAKQLVMSDQTDQFKWCVWGCGVRPVLPTHAEVCRQLAVLRTFWQRKRSRLCAFETAYYNAAQTITSGVSKTETTNLYTKLLRTKKHWIIFGIYCKLKKKNSNLPHK